jgi:hypothetical protein
VVPLLADDEVIQLLAFNYLSTLRFVRTLRAYVPEQSKEWVVDAREARLRPAYREWYPDIEAGVWHNAAWLSEKVLQQQRLGSPSWALGARPLSDAHFEFQGHGPPPGRKARQVVSNAPRAHLE